MEDYNSNLLNDSKNEWSIRLMNIMSGHIIDGFRSIFRESIEVCEQNEEPEKYLMTFQNFLSRIPKWNQNMIETEAKRIIENSKCEYLEDLITCVHVIQLKILSCVRTSNHNKRIEIDVPNFTTFLHNVYINIARKLYSNIYLFQVDITSLEQQKNNREFELIVQSCIMNTIRDNIPIDQLLRQYIDETQEVDIEKTEKIIEKEVEAPKEPVSAPDNISFNENVEKHDPVNNETSSLPLNDDDNNNNNNNEDKEEERPVIVTDLPSEIMKETNDVVDIGEPISLDVESFDTNHVEQQDTSNEVMFDDSLKIMDDVTLGGFENLDEPVVEEKKDDIIDLGVMELSI